jgi:hypothetical protein
VISSRLSSAFSQPLSLALADAPRQYPRSYRGFPAVSERSDYSLDQRLVGQPLPCHAINEAVEPLQGMPFHIALIDSGKNATISGDNQ